MGTIERSWYTPGATQPWLLPLAGLFAAGAAARRWAYRQGWLAVERVGVPVLVVGNITVGGSGKTPLVAAIAERLAARGRKVGIVARGYGGKAERYPLFVDVDTSAAQAGDEPAMLARTTGLAVAVAPRRAAAARYLIERHGVDFILCDDGLQHYALARDGEIAVLDARRGLGNGYRLPAGPLRESPRRLETVDLALTQGPVEGSTPGDYRLVGDQAIALVDGRRVALSRWAGQRVHAVAGIGDPQRFFDMLRGLGLNVEAHPLADHHRFDDHDIRFDDDDPVLMTDKDAVKCTAWADARHWRIPARVVLTADCERRIDALLDRLCNTATPGGDPAPAGAGQR